MTTVELDTTRAPIFVVVMKQGLTDEDLIAHHAEIDAAIVAHAGGFCLAYDVQTDGMSNRQRDLQMAWIRRFQAAHGERNLGVAFAHASKVARGVLRALHWVSKPSYEYTIEPDLASALVWCRGKVQRVAATPRAAREMGGS